MLTILSLGAGVQSTTLALMAAHGEITPMPDCAIFADTRWESRKTYEHLGWLSSQNVLPFPVRRISRADIRDGIKGRRNTTGGRFAAIPWWTKETIPAGTTVAIYEDDEEGNKVQIGMRTLEKDEVRFGMGRRQCSSEYKLEPIMREVRSILGAGMRDRIPASSVSVMIGISLDEAQRMKPARQRYMVNRWPLIEKGLRRYDCERWLTKHEYPVPPKSACLGCPFHDDAYWFDMKENRPGEWAEVVEYDRLLRTGDSRGIRAVEFMHRQCVPLDEVNFSRIVDDPQMDLFGNECEGICGV